MARLTSGWAGGPLGHRHEHDPLDVAQLAHQLVEVAVDVATAAVVVPEADHHGLAQPVTVGADEVDALGEAAADPGVHAQVPAADRLGEVVLGPEQDRIAHRVHRAVTGTHRRRRDDDRGVGRGAALVGRPRGRCRLRGRHAERPSQRAGRGEELPEAVEARGPGAGGDDDGFAARVDRDLPASDGRRLRVDRWRVLGADGSNDERQRGGQQDDERDGAAGEVEEQGTAARHGRGGRRRERRWPGPAVRSETSAGHPRRWRGRERGGERIASSSWCSSG